MRKRLLLILMGSVSEYPKTVLENHKQHLLERKQMLNDQIAGIDKDLDDIETAKVEATKVKPEGEENLG